MRYAFEQFYTRFQAGISIQTNTEAVKSKKLSEVEAERDALKKQLEAVQPKLKELVDAKRALELHLSADKARFSMPFPLFF